jgi:hypothetical protein
MATVLPQGSNQFFDNAGNPLAGGTLRADAAGTNTLKAIFADAAGTVPLANPLTLDSAGRATIFWDGAYKVTLRDSANNLIWTVDGVQGDGSALRTDLAATGGSARVGFIQSGAGMRAQDVEDKLREAISVTDATGFTGNGVTDDRSAVLAAAAEARATGKMLYCPRGFTVRLSASTDLTGIKYIRFESPIVIPTGTVTVGGFFNSGGGRIEFDNVTNGGSLFAAPPAQPVLRVTGLSESFVSVGSCNFLQLYADAGVSENRAVSYNQFRLTGAVTLLGMTDSGVALSYVNENFIYADRIERLSIVGVGYGHNHNKIFHPCMEGSNVSLTFTNTSMNQIYGVRFETVSASPGITFNSTSFSNTVMFTWSGAGSPEDQFRIAIPVSDSGRGNMVTSEAATQFHKTQAFAVGPNSGIVGTATSSAAADPRISPATNGLFVNGGPALLTPSLLGFTPPTFEFIALSDPIPVQLGDVIVWDVDFDGSILRPAVYVLDSQMRPLTSESGGGAYYQQTDLTTLDATYGFYTSAGALSAAQMRPGSIRRSEVAFVRIGGYLSSAGFVRYFSASVYSQAMNRGRTEGEAARRYQFLTIDGAPTRGYVQQGTAIYDRVTRVMRFCTRAQESTLTAALSAGATSATVASGTGLANGDIVGILLDNQTTHWTTVSALAGNTFTIAAIPAGRSAPINGRVVFNRWSS